MHAEGIRGLQIAGGPPDSADRGQTMIGVKLEWRLVKGEIIDNKPLVFSRFANGRRDDFMVYQGTQKPLNSLVPEETSGIFTNACISMH